MNHNLVIGYGNPDRQDDGVAWHILCALAREKGYPSPFTYEDEFPANDGLDFAFFLQLTPEMAERISQARTVFFIDASVEAPKEVQVRKLEPNPTCQVMAHAADPRTMLALARDVYGHCPEGWWVTIPARRMGIGDDLSTVATRGMSAAIQTVRRRCSRLGARQT